MTRPQGRVPHRHVGFATILLTLLMLFTSTPLAFVETRAYRPALTFGHEGREDGLFRQPSGGVVDRTGQLYITDTYNHRVQLFMPDGRFFQSFGSEGSQRGALSRPKGVALGSDDLVYVADTGNHRIQAFNKQGQAVLILGSFGNAAGQFNTPEGVAIDASGALYVADTQNHRVQKFAADGRFLTSWGGSGSDRGKFFAPADIAIDLEGRVLVADTQNHRVQVFTSDGQYLWEIGRAGRGAAEFDSPRGIATDGEGNIYVADTGNGRVQIFDHAGRYLTYVGHLGRGLGEFYYPAGLWTDGQHTLYVADTINHRVQVLTYFPAVARLEQGWQAFHAAQWDRAVEAWHEALHIDPTLVEALYATGLAYTRQGQLDLAVTHLNAALRLQPEYGAARWALYRVYLRYLTWPLGVVGFIASVSVGTLVVRRLRRRVLRERGRRLMDEGRVRETIATYERLLQFDRDDVNVCKTLETLYEQEGLEVKRKQVNEIIARLEPDNIYALAYIGKQQLAEGAFLEAQQTWEHILQQDPSHPEASFYLGVVLSERGQGNEAITAFRRALTLAITRHVYRPEEDASDVVPAGETDLAASIAAWDTELRQGISHERALASFQQARQSLAQHYVSQGQAYLERDDADEAIRCFRWADALNPGNGEAHVLLQAAQTRLTFEHGIRYYQAQDYVQALRCFRETLALEPGHEKAKRYLRYAQQCLAGGLSERFRHLDLGDREKS